MPTNRNLNWKYSVVLLLQKENNEANLPISLELVIKSELCPSLHNFGGEEANSELTIHCPLWETTT